MQGEWIYQTNRGGRWKSRFTRTKVLAELYAKLSKDHCERCGYNASSQRHHDCILIPLKDRIEILFDELIKRANAGEEANEAEEREEDINEILMF